MKYAVISCSLSESSKSRILCDAVVRALDTQGATDVEYVDLAEYELPQCDGGSAYGHPNVKALSERLTPVDGIVIGFPIYNYGGNGAVKNFIDLSPVEALGEKIIGFACAAGGGMSYMAPMSIANCLMFNYRSVIVPRFVYATGEHFDDTAITDETIQNRVDELASNVIRMATALRGNPAQVPSA